MKNTRHIADSQVRLVLGIAIGVLLQVNSLFSECQIRNGERSRSWSLKDGSEFTGTVLTKDLKNNFVAIQLMANYQVKIIPISTLSEKDRVYLGAKEEPAEDSKVADVYTAYLEHLLGGRRHFTPEKYHANHLLGRRCNTMVGEVEFKKTCWLMNPESAYLVYRVSGYHMPEGVDVPDPRIHYVLVPSRMRNSFEFSYIHNRERNKSILEFTQNGWVPSMTYAKQITGILWSFDNGYAIMLY